MPPRNGLNITRCRANTSYKGWRIAYFFPSEDRKKWSAYDDKVQSLLNTLEIKQEVINSKDTKELFSKKIKLIE